MYISYIYIIMIVIRSVYSTHLLSLSVLKSTLRSTMTKSVTYIKNLPTELEDAI